MSYKITESKLQESCVTWFRYNYPALKLCLFAVPNSLFIYGVPKQKLMSAGAKQKREGLIAGVPDLVLMYNGTAYGVEMKLPYNKLQDVQEKVHESWKSQGIDVFVIRSFEEFKKLIESIIK
jgi:hypothetical protein